MRKFNTIKLLILGLLLGSTVTAQEILVVDPGSGTLNTAIATHGGDRIYQLQAGQWYGLDAIIENVDYHLQIVGEDYDDETMPATLQTGMTPESLPLGMMFDAKGNITLKNIYLLNADLNGQIAATFLVQSDSASFVNIDNCVIDPIGTGNPLNMTGGDNDLFFTNNIVCRHGNMLGANDGHLFVISANAANAGADTVWIENNTFVSTGTNILIGTFDVHINNFILMNHNTFMHHKSQIDWSIFENEYYMTNNLFFDFMTAPYAYHWQPMPGGDIAMPKPMLIYADTLDAEVLPSSRSQFIQYNNMYHSQGFYDLVAEMNDTAAATGINKVNLHPLIWDGTQGEEWGDHPDSTWKYSREGHLFNHANNVNTDFPNWKYGNTTYDLDPEWNNQMIYDLSDSLVLWSRPASFIHAQGQAADRWPAPTEWAQWHWDPDGDPAVNSTWPVFDGTYTNSATLVGSIANLPLGDLNWFPEKKVIWEWHKDEIFAHMKAGNTDKLDFTSIPQVADNGSNFSKVYPNPMSSSAQIQFTLDNAANVQIAIYNAVGQRVRHLMDEFRPAGSHTVTFDRGNLNHGVYFYTIEAGNQSETKKLMIVD